MMFIYINFSFDSLGLDNVDFKITLPMNSLDGSFLTPLELELRPRVLIKHSCLCFK
jgi:hypothetical protein